MSASSPQSSSTRCRSTSLIKLQKDPLRAVKLPLGLRIGMVQAMDAWQLCYLAPSFVLPMRPDEATGLLITDVDFRRRRLRFGTRFGGRDFNKGRRSFEVPFPPELDRLFNGCMQGRTRRAALRRRAVFEGREPTFSRIYGNRRRRNSVRDRFAGNSTPRGPGRAGYEEHFPSRTSTSRRSHS